MTAEDRHRILAELGVQRADLAQKLSRLDDLIQFVGTENISVNGTQAHASAAIYSNAKTLADLSKICLQSVNGAGLTPREIADRLIEANAVKSPHGLSGHISTALKRRMSSPLSPDSEIELADDGRFRCRSARPTHG